MIIWVDADACPRDAKDMIYRTAMRLEIKACLVANNPLRTPKSPWISVEVVGHGFDVADDYIADNVAEHDVVITADIPLAARIVDKGAHGLDPRGQMFTEENVKSRLATRDLLSELRDQGMTGDQGIVGGGPPPYKPKDKSKFASALDRLLTRLKKEGR